jgi:hypothetical protein
MKMYEKEKEKCRYNIIIYLVVILVTSGIRGNRDYPE